MLPPRHKAMVGVRYSPTASLDLSAHVYFVDSVSTRMLTDPTRVTTVPSYVRVDVRGEYALSKNASLAIGAQDVLDSWHREGGSTAMDTGEVPLTVYAQLRLRLP